MTILIFILVLTVLIFVHELGHFLAARWCGIRVDAFKIGFGPKLFAWKRGETEYGVNTIPFGGYVKIHGENPDAEAETGPDAGRSFVNKPRWKQAIVLVAGVTFNFVFAWLIYAVAFMSGVTATPEGFERYADDIYNHRVMITNVAPDSPAAEAGLQIGDVIVAVSKPSQDSSQPIAVEKVGGLLPVEGIQSLIAESEGVPLEIVVDRSGTTEMISVTPTQGVIEGRYAVGIAMQTVGDLKLSFFASIVESARYTWMMMKETTVGLATFVGNIFRGSANFSDVAGPVGIAGIVGDAAGLGFTYLLMITALISINLGVINLIPFPALDGGRLLFVGIESVIRRRIPMVFANVTNAIGFFLLMLLMVVITYKDIARLVK